MKPLHAIIREAFRMPAKSILTLITVGLGVGTLILAMSTSDSFQKAITEQLTGDGLIINVANARYSVEGGLEPVRPVVFDQEVLSIVAAGVSGIQGVAPLASTTWRTVTIGSNQYQIRRVIGSTPDYMEVMGLQLAAGSFFTQEDVRSGETKAVITRSAAEALFGSAEAALGKTIQPPVRGSLERGSGGSTQRTVVAQIFTIVGVFEDVDEIKRRAYGIADVVIPYTTGVQGGMNIASQMQSLIGTFAVRTTQGSFSAAEAQIRDVLTRQYGPDIAIHIWEGQPNGVSSMLEETRNAIATFSLVINLLGFVLLLTGSIGILSIMIVEVLGKNKDIAMERALGASKGSIVSEFFFRSVFMSILSVAVGIALSLVFADPISRLLWPIISGVDTGTSVQTVLTFRSAAIGASAALIIGGVFGSIPVFSSFKAPIADSIREG